jgi:cyclophilin family peptidyl-prolyl cis-trans isomerase
MLFHRVIKDFMIQSGDPNSKHAKSGEQLGNGSPDYSIPAEFRTSLFHYKGVIAAAREGDDVNPKKTSSGSQFYIVQGKKYSMGLLDSAEADKKIVMSAEQKKAYSKIGGTPWLDGSYTVFGEVIKGLDIIDSIATVKTDSMDRPVNDVRIIKMKLIKRGK